MDTSEAVEKINEILDQVPDYRVGDVIYEVQEGAPPGTTGIDKEDLRSKIESAIENEIDDLKYNIDHEIGNIFDDL